jgi:hypothetical protein
MFAPGRQVHVSEPESKGATPRSPRRTAGQATTVVSESRGKLWRLVSGGEYVEEGAGEKWGELLLPWPIRWLLTLGVVVIAWSWGDAGVGQQLAWGLQIGALSVVAFVASSWWIVLAVDSVIAAAWIPFDEPPKSPGWQLVLHAVTFLNRQFGHVAALLVWVLVAFATSARLPLQLGGAAFVFFLAPDFLNGAAREFDWPFLSPDSRTRKSGGLLWRRRILIYVLTVVGLLALALRAPAQLGRMLPLVGAFSGGLVLRSIRYDRRRRRLIEEEKEGLAAGFMATDGMSARRQNIRTVQVAMAQAFDPIGPLVVLAAMGALVTWSSIERRKLDAELSAKLDGPVLPTDACVREPHGPIAADVAMFVMADVQTHELGGERFPGQTELAEAFVSTASRPLALDMLSEVPVRRFAAMYKELSEQRVKKQLPPMLWAHLGDLTDLACRGELRRVSALMKLFEPASNAGISLGNHEMSFIGSFHWSPYWDTACATGRLDKEDVIDAIQGTTEPGGWPGEAPKIVLSDLGRMARVRPSFLSPRGGSLAMARPLGVANHDRRARGVIGVFLDASDGHAFDWGMPGSIGAISAAQLEGVAQAILSVQKDRQGPYEADPAYVLFSHFPLGALAGPSHARIAEFITHLDRRDVTNTAEPRVLAWVAAHTHAADAHRHCMGSRILREIVIGSTTDPPQQAGLLEIGPDARGRLALGLRTVQSVARPGVTCSAGQPNGQSSPLTAAKCRRIASELTAAPECHGLLGTGPDSAAPRDCQELEIVKPLGDELAELRTYRGPFSAGERKRIEQMTAEHLLSCVCRQGDCKPIKQPLSIADGSREESYLGVLAPLSLPRSAAVKPRGDTIPASQTNGEPPQNRDTEAELSCLAWAASVSQAHKMAGMTLGEALRCGFDDPTLAPERVWTATLEDVTCY